MLYGTELAFSGTMLVPEPSIPVSPTLALALGGDVIATMVVQQLHFWVATNMIGEVHDGRRWVRQSYDDWQRLIPYVSTKTIQRVVSGLRRRGLILAQAGIGKDSDPFDRGLWYTVDYEAVQDLVRPVLMKRLAQSGGDVSAVFIDKDKMSTSVNSVSAVSSEEKSGGNAVFSDMDKMSTSIGSECPHPLSQNFQMFYSINNNNKYRGGLEKNSDNDGTEQALGKTPTLVKSPRKKPGAGEANPRYEALLEIWNQERGPLAKAKRVTAKYAAGFNKLIHDYGDETEVNFRLAVKLIVSRGYYLKDGVPYYGLENLLAGDNYIKHVETALAAQKATQSSAVSTEQTGPHPQDVHGFELKSSDFVPPDTQRLAQKSLDELREYLAMGLDGKNRFVCRAVEGVVLWEVTTLQALNDPTIPNALFKEAVSRFPQYQIDNKLF